MDNQKTCDRLDELKFEVFPIVLISQNIGYTERLKQHYKEAFPRATITTFNDSDWDHIVEKIDEVAKSSGRDIGILLVPGSIGGRGNKNFKNKPYDSIPFFKKLYPEMLAVGLANALEQEVYDYLKTQGADIILDRGEIEVLRNIDWTKQHVLQQP